MSSQELKERERQQFVNLMVDSLILLCRNGILSEDVTQVDGTIGITLEGGDVFLINLRDVYEARKNLETPVKGSDSPRTNAFFSQTEDLVSGGESKRKRFKQDVDSSSDQPSEDEDMDTLFESSDVAAFPVDETSQSSDFSSFPLVQSGPRPRGRPRVKELLAQADEDYVNAEVENDFKEGKTSGKVYQKIKRGEIKLKPGNIFVWKYFEDLGETKSICLGCEKQIQLKDRFDRDTMWQHALECDRVDEAAKRKIPKFKDEEKMKAVKAQVWGRSFKSKVWTYFQRPPGKALCLLCNNMVLKGYNGNTRTLWNHIKRCPATNDSLELQEGDGDNMAEDGSSLDTREEGQPTPKLVGKSTGRHRSSKVWNYFKILPDTISICKFCQATLSLIPGQLSDSLNSLWDHLLACPNVKHEEHPLFQELREAERMKQLKWKTFGRQFKSQVWEYFERPPGKAKCIFCSKLLNRGPAGNTTNLWNHVHSCNKIDEASRLELEGVEPTPGNQFLCDMCSFTTYFPAILKKHMERHDRDTQGTTRGRGRGRGRPPTKHRFTLPRAPTQPIKVEQDNLTMYTTDTGSFIDGTFVQSGLDGQQPVYIHLQDASQVDNLDLQGQYIEVHQEYVEVPSESVIVTTQSSAGVGSEAVEVTVTGDDDEEEEDEDTLKLYKCHACGELYEDRDHLLRHMTTKHTEYAKHQGMDDS